ncbi:MAG: prefoldin subunit [archaeon]|jgi:prefoldin beta subunit|nr:prefoldin subunit [archaeon]MDD2477911.1 prefoldin subunit [Candidatus ainarchaeum sp.]MDD3084462.1 prefoldin subunit [Candidatus ainarchaeum sp.]MDD4220924.1 prefoldin subunit [Candidatus ainarchaeum sp.]MDD4662896.1 prefoldin subunit [Candidatus ainarchaeum sp.]
MSENKNTNMMNNYRQQLMYVSQQKQQLQLQKNIFESTIKELEATKEKKVYKGVGNVLIMTDKEGVIKSTKNNLETVNLKLKTVEKQETDIITKLNELSKVSKKTVDSEEKVPTNSSEGIA